MLKEAIAKIEEMARPMLYTEDNHTFVVNRDGELAELKPDTPVQTTVYVNSLDALIALVKNEGARYEDDALFISVDGHTKVMVFGNPRKELDELRICYFEANAKDVPGWDATTKMPFDQAAVALQTRFQEGGDREYTLTLLSQITCGAMVTYNDIGVATTVVTQKGVSLQQNSTIRPIVKLRPYRTFQEVEQPEGLFLIRIDERGITFTEADGGMWKLTARKTIKAYLEDALKDGIEAGKVVVMM